MVFRNFHFLKTYQSINSRIINNLRYADDIVLLARDEIELDNLILRIKDESGNLDLHSIVNATKTKIMIVDRKTTTDLTYSTLINTK